MNDRIATTAIAEPRTRRVVAPNEQHGRGITPRRARWDFPDDLDDVFADDLSEDCSRVAFSMTLPHLEPYLIRTFRGLVETIDEPGLAADVRAFCAQEAHHHRNHRRINDIIKGRLGEATAARLDTIEAQLAADYDRFTRTSTIRFNAAYAEGFEAMTCAMGLTGLEKRRPPSRYGPWQQMWAWHLAEEIEHRTVAFDVYEAVCGSYPYRAAVGLAAQLHFLRYNHRLYRVLMEHHGRRVRVPHVPPMLRRGVRRYLRTFSPTYTPAAIEVPPQISALLATFTEQFGGER